MTLIQLALIPIGFGVGAYGTLIGAGGGFVLVPVLLFLYPRESPATITAISLAVVFFNAVSGSLAYHREKRIDYRSGVLFAVATLPGAIAGALVVDRIPRGVFDVMFGIALLLLGSIVIFRAAPKEGVVTSKRGGLTSRAVVDARGQRHEYEFSSRHGILISVAVGFLSSLLGIGGGIIHVPALVQILNFPVHIATATSQFILAVMAFAGSLVHVVQGDLTPGTGLRRSALLAVGVIPGAQLGAYLSRRLHGPLIIRLLGVALLLVGLRLLISPLFH